MIAKNIEYEEAPSGNVTFYNYKEPLMKYTGGYGFVGALVFDSETKKIQCHLCGQWFLSLPPHLAKEHNMRAQAYKEEVGLNKSTALINEDVRAKLIAKGLEKRMKNLRPNKSHSKESRRKISETLKKNTLENQNLRGTCPMQLLDRLKKKYIELGRTPSENELGCYDTMVKVHGSMKMACQLAGVPYRKPSSTIAHERGTNRKFTKVQCLEWLESFVDLNGRLPKYKDFGKKNVTLWKTMKHYGVEDLFRELCVTTKYRKVANRIRYSKKHLVTLLQNFEGINGRKPSYSDCKRGLLPCLSKFSYHFGSWQNALKLAFN